MSFQSRNGTYGGRPPRGWLMRWFNRQAVKRIKRRGGRFRGMNVLVLTTVGKKSHELRDTTLAFGDLGLHRVRSLAGSGGRSWVADPTIDTV